MRHMKRNFGPQAVSNNKIWGQDRIEFALNESANNYFFLAL